MEKLEEPMMILALKRTCRIIQVATTMQAQEDALLATRFSKQGSPSAQESVTSAAPTLQLIGMQPHKKQA